ncbi:MAG: ferrochelatase [Pseudomonadota bacterium]
MSQSSVQTPPADHRPVGVLITNLGTPQTPSTGSVRRFLREFLSDPRVVEFPRALWWLILNGIILLIRPSRSASLYRRVWSDDGSPLLVNSLAQQRALAAALPEATVVLGMRYGEPSIEQAIAQLEGAGVERLLVLPLYPQYSATTTASTFDALAQAYRSRRHLPEIRFVPDYHDEPGYIDALAASVRAARSQPVKRATSKLLLSFHGIPQRYADKGDPYPRQCEQTARLLAECLGLAEDEWAMSYQSRVGREPWLKPYTDKLLETWGEQGVKQVDVLCPGFSADCLETIDEIGVENREVFEEAGGDELTYIPALNASSAHIDALSALVRRRMTDWR